MTTQEDAPSRLNHTCSVLPEHLGEDVFRLQYPNGTFVVRRGNQELYRGEDSLQSEKIFHAASGTPFVHP